MTDLCEKLLPSDPDDVALALRHALLFDRKKRFDGGRDAMAAITAAHLLEAISRAGFVVMKRPVTPPRNDWPTVPKGE